MKLKLDTMSLISAAIAVAISRFGYLDGHRGDRRTHLVPSTQDASAIAEGSTCSPHTP